MTLTPEKVGLQPYVTNEYWERIRAAMREYRGLVAAKKDTKPVEAEIVFLCGIMGHFVADGSQPLHTTIEYNGWTSANPNAYTTDHKIHAQFESQFVSENVNAGKDVAPLIAKTPVVLADPFDDYVKYLRAFTVASREDVPVGEGGRIYGCGVAGVAGVSCTNGWRLGLPSYGI